MSSQSKVLLAAIFGTFMVILDQTIMNVALPHIMAVFNETPDRAQLIVSAYLMATAITTPAAAYMGARFGIKKVFLLSQVGFLAGSVLCGVAWNADSLIVFRVLQGLSGGLLSPMAMTLLFLNVPPQKRGGAMAVFGVPMLLAPAIGPTLGGYLVTYWDWRWCFYVNVPVVILAIILGLAWIQEMAISRASLDWRGFFLAAVGFSTVLYGLSYAPTWGWGDLRILILFGIGGLCLCAWIISELREKENPMLNLHIFNNRGYSLAMGLNVIMTIGLFSALFLLPLFLQNLRGLSALDSGMLILPAAIGSMLTMPISGQLYDKVGPRVPAIIGLVITAFSTLWLQYMDVTTAFDQFRWVMIIRGMGIGLAMMPIMTYALAAVPQKMTAQASSLMNITRTVFASLGIAIFATLLDSFHKSNLGTMVQVVTPDSMEANRILSAIQVTLMQGGQTLEAARQTAITLLYQLVDQQAYVLAFQTDYLISAIIVFIGLVPALFLPHGKAHKPESMPDISP